MPELSCGLPFGKRARTCRTPSTNIVFHLAGGGPQSCGPDSLYMGADGSAARRDQCARSASDRTSGSVTEAFMMLPWNFVQLSASGAPPEMVTFSPWNAEIRRPLCAWVRASVALRKYLPARSTTAVAWDVAARATAAAGVFSGAASVPAAESLPPGATKMVDAASYAGAGPTAPRP